MRTKTRMYNIVSWGRQIKEFRVFFRENYKIFERLYIIKFTIIYEIYTCYLLMY